MFFVVERIICNEKENTLSLEKSLLLAKASGDEDQILGQTPLPKLQRNGNDRKQHQEDDVGAQCLNIR